MSGIMLSFNYSRRVAIDGDPLSQNAFEARFLLNPDGDQKLSSNYGYLNLTVSGDATKIPDKSLSEIEVWLRNAVTQMLASKLDKLE